MGTRDRSDGPPPRARRHRRALRDRALVALRFTGMRVSEAVGADVEHLEPPTSQPP